MAHRAPSLAPSNNDNDRVSDARNPPHSSTPLTTKSHASPSRLAVVLTSSPKRLSSSGTQGTLTQSTLPQLWELSKRVKQNLNVRLPPPSPPAPSSSSARPQPALVAAPEAEASRSGRGRPRGWKPGMSYAMMRGNTSLREGRDKHTHPKSLRQSRVKANPTQPSASVSGRRPGRPPRPPSPTARQLYEKTAPQFIVFSCEWKGCKAELHNIDTLRRHVHLVHVRDDGGGCATTCRWGQCGSAGFQRVQDWHSHLETAHLVPFTWHLGDGPCNAIGALSKASTAAQGDEAIPDYLLSPDGNQVTPSIKDQKLEDFATWRENRRKLKQLLIQRDKNLPDEETSESSD